MIRYATAAAFKQAVETRLRSSSSSGIDFARRRQLLVFDRFLARIACGWSFAGSHSAPKEASEDPGMR